MGKYYLSHHGIEGQKWGVRNGPPYPLDRKRNIRDRINSRIEYEKQYKKEHKVETAFFNALSTGQILLQSYFITRGNTKMVVASNAAFLTGNIVLRQTIRKIRKTKMSDINN